ncbi:MAG: hypothetical protein IAF02_13240 [Anaerolineae bacterium]|nr:hypothetical protein [Anaerolineae bacterium]
MTANTYQTNSYSEETGHNSTTAVAVIVGLVLGGVFTFLWNGLPLMAVAGMWLLALAIGFIGVAIISNRRRETSEWGIALVGQVLGAIGIALIFLASVM